MTADRDPFDSKFDAMLRDHSNEIPSQDLDTAILAAAHRAVQSAPHAAEKPAEATSPWRWWMPLAAAATIGAVTIGVFQLLPKEPDATTATVVSDTPARSKSEAASPPPLPAPSQSEATSPPLPAAAPVQKDRVEPSRAPSEAPRAKVRTDRQKQLPAEKSETQRLAAPEPFPAPRRDATPRESAESVPSGAELESKPQSAQQENAAGTLMRRDAPQAAAPAIAKQSAASADTSVATPAQWIARIRTLLDDGKAEDAARELIAFRAAYPDADARLPAELQAWGATIKR